jgi:threonine/homoserine/homoserine lactone efflux protein
MIDWWPFITYMLVMSLTPGPNNVMLLASGVRFGFRRTLPHLLGVNFGFTALSLLVCAAIGAVARWLPLLQSVLAYVGVAYMAWLAWQLMRAGAPGEVRAARPISAAQAVALQVLNPKAWVMAVTTASVFMPTSGSLPPMLSGIALVLVGVNLPCIALWAVGGSAFRRWLGQDRYRFGFNALMAAMLVMAALGMLRAS